MKTKTLTMTTLAFLIMLNVNCQWQTNGSNISCNTANVSINAKLNWASLNVGGTVLLLPGSSPNGGDNSTWGTSIAMDATSLNGGQLYNICSLGGSASEGTGKFLIRNYNYQALLILDSLGNFGIGTTAPSARLQVSNGDIYIDNINKGVIMKSPNGQCWRGTLDNTGNLGFSQIDCPIADTVQKTTLTKKIKLINHTLIYPNPTENSIYVEVENYNGEILTAAITNSSGQIINIKLISSKVTTINTSNMTTGMYILTIKDKNGNSLSSNKIMRE